VPSQIRNSKSEIRNKLEIRNLKLETGTQVSNFGFRTFGFVSDFDIRISDLASALGSHRLEPHEEVWS
jgi:hypothetical protein